MFGHLEEMYGEKVAKHVVILLFAAVCSSVLNWVVFALFCNAVMLFGVGHLFLFFVLLIIDIALICLSYSRTMNSEWKECPPVSTSTALFVISLFLNLMEVGLALSIRKAVQELTTQGIIVNHRVLSHDDHENEHENENEHRNEPQNISRPQPYPYYESTNPSSYHNQYFQPGSYTSSRSKS